MHYLPTEEQSIREAAYFAWERAGKPSGDGVEFWLAAERAFLARAAAAPGREGDPRHEQELVEEALEETFPASDPPAWMP